MIPIHLSAWDYSSGIFFFSLFFYLSLSSLVLDSYFPLCVSGRELFSPCPSHIVTFRQKLCIWPLEEYVSRWPYHFPALTLQRARNLTLLFFFFFLTFSGTLLFSLLLPGNRLCCLLSSNLRAISIVVHSYVIHLYKTYCRFCGLKQKHQFLLVKSSTNLPALSVGYYTMLKWNFPGCILTWRLDKNIDLYTYFVYTEILLLAEFIWRTGSSLLADCLTSVLVVFCI